VQSTIAACNGVISAFAACTSTVTFQCDASSKPVAPACATLQTAFDACVGP
jgi:hypothetical protein